MERIFLRGALNEMDSGKPFSIVFYTADRNKETGGERIELENCTTTFINSTKSTPATDPAKNDTLRAPHHFRHATRNLVLPNKQMRKVHIYLITQLNGKKVIY